MKPTGPTNPLMRGVVMDLERAGKGSKLWKDVAERLTKPTRSRAAVNLTRISRHAAEGESIVVPGKVLGQGSIDKKLRIAAFSFSGSAKDKIEKAGGKALQLEEMAKENPKGSKIRIMV